MCGTAYPGEGPCPRCKYTPTRQQFYGKKVTAGDVIPFDPSRRRNPSVKSIPFPAEFAPDQTQEDREALFYAYDNTLNDLRGLFNVAEELGEQETAMNIQAAIDALSAANRKR